MGTDSICVTGRIVHNGTLRGKQKTEGIRVMGLSPHGSKVLKDYLGIPEELQFN